MPAEQVRDYGHELYLRELLARTIPLPVRPREVRALCWDEEGFRFRAGLTAQRVGYDPARWAPREGIGAPVAWVGVHGHQARQDKSSGGYHERLAVVLDQTVRVSGPLGQARNRVVEADRFELGIGG